MLPDPHFQLPLFTFPYTQPCYFSTSLYLCTSHFLILHYSVSLTYHYIPDITTLFHLIFLFLHLPYLTLRFLISSYLLILCLPYHTLPQSALL